MNRNKWINRILSLTVATTMITSTFGFLNQGNISYAQEAGYFSENIDSNSEDSDYGDISVVEPNQSFRDFHSRYSEEDIKANHLIEPSPAAFDTDTETSYIKKANSARGIKKYDPRTLNIISPAKNQDDLGICWAFAGLSAYEAYTAKNGLGLNDFSEEHMRWWAKNGTHNWRIGDEEGATNEAPVGYLTSWSGPKMESDIPYNGHQTEKQGAKKPANYDSAPLYDYRVTDVVKVKPDIYSVKDAVYNYGAVMTGYFEDSLYASRDNNAFYCDEPLGQNHAVAIVGWDDNFPRSRFDGKAKPDSNGAWLVKSSWGPFNSEKGFVWVSYEDKTILSYTDNYAVSGQIKYNGQKLYQHEYSYSSMISSKKILGANVFDFNENNEVLEGVMFVTDSEGATYRIFYIPVEGGKPVYAKRKLLKTGVVEHAGYTTAQLQDFALPNGKGAVAVEIDNTQRGRKSTMGVEMNVKDFYAFVAHGNVGESFLYQGGKFYDVNINGNYKPANLAIKAITNKSDGGSRIAGSNRFDTANMLASYAYQNAENAVLVNSDAIVDALTSSSLASLLKAPILLSDKDRLPASTYSEIKKLGVKNITIIGGYGSVSGAVEHSLKRSGYTVNRISGANRYETASKIAKEVKSRNRNVSEVAVVNGYKGLPDAISFSTVSGEKSIPLILTNRDGVLDRGKEFVNDPDIKASYIIGGTGSVSSTEESKLKNATRIAGRNRQDTNAKIIQKFYPDSSYDSVFVVKDGSDNPSHLIDGLAVGPVGAVKKSPLVIGSWGLSDEQKNVLRTKHFNNVIQVGGGLSATVKTELINLSGGN